MKATAEKIRKHRESLNYSQEYLAGKLGISQPAYAKIEKGITGITLKRLHMISLILQINLQELWEDSEVIKQPPKDDSYTLMEKLYQNNKTVYENLIDQLRRENKRLLDENKRLWDLLNKEGK